MTLLLDTQVLLWMSLGDPQLPAETLATIESHAEPVLLSAIVFWEVAIKTAKKRLTVRDDFREQLDAFGFTPLAVTRDHAWAVGGLPAHHADPFDRLLVAQAQIEGATLVTSDEAMRAYDVSILWG